MTRGVREAMDALIGKAAREAGVERAKFSKWRSSAIRSCITSCSASTRPSSAARRSRSLDAAYEARARELGLDIAPGAFVYVLPCIAGHVGADAAGACSPRARTSRTK